MLGFLSSYLPLAQNLIGTYIEPFVGGGSVFFYLSPKIALLSDTNSELIDLYRGIRYSPSAVWEKYCAFGSNKKAYTVARDCDQNSLLTDRAARTLFLNRTCFKGMWRHNKNGKFNVGYGGQQRRWVINEEALKKASALLRRASIQCKDFEDVIDSAGAGDFLFVDPPYRPGYKDLHNAHYLAKPFTFSDQGRLASSLNRAKKRGASWALTNSNHREIVRLYKKSYFREFLFGTGERPGILRSKTGEVLITSFSTGG